MQKQLEEGPERNLTRGQTWWKVIRRKASRLDWQKTRRLEELNAP